MKNQTMNIAAFLKAYRKGVRIATGQILTTEALAKKLSAGIVGNTISQWEQRGNIPRDEKHRRAISNFFGLDSLEEITQDQLEEAVAAYPNKVEKTAAPQRPDTLPQSVSQMQFLMSQNIKQAAQIEQLLQSMQQLISTNAQLSGALAAKTTK